MKNRFARIAILILNWNGKKDTLECLASVQKIEYPNFQTIVVDNGSADDSVAAIRAAYPDIPILETHANLGFAGGNNFGIQWLLRHHAEWILLLNNDTTVDPHLLSAFMAASQEQKNGKIFGAKILRYSDPARIDHCGGFWNPKIAEFESPLSGKIDNIYLADMKEVDYVCGASLLMHRSVPEAIGLLEPKFFLFWEETDFCFRAKRAGFEIWTAPEAKIWHKVSSSFTGGKPHMHYFWWRSRLLWIERNCTPQEKQALYRSVILPELWKTLRHYLLKLFSSNKEKRRRLKAGLCGAIDYFRGKFGNCPEWLLRKIN